MTFTAHCGIFRVHDPPTPQQPQPQPPLLRKLDKPEVPWRIRVDAADKAELKTALPMSGAQTWAINTALKAFLDLMERAEPSLRTWAHIEIQRALYPAAPGTKREYEDLSAEIPTELYVRFSQLFPEMGAASWFVRRFVHALAEDFRGGETLESRIEAIVNRAMTPTPEPDAEIVHMQPDE